MAAPDSKFVSISPPGSALYPSSSLPPANSSLKMLSAAEGVRDDELQGLLVALERLMNSIHHSMTETLKVGARALRFFDELQNFKRKL